jgi:hypothetical protein
MNNKNHKLNSMLSVCEYTIPTERPPFVGEVIANCLRIDVSRPQCDRYLRSYSRFHSIIIFHIKFNLCLNDKCSAYMRYERKGEQVLRADCTYRASV